MAASGGPANAVLADELLEEEEEVAPVLEPEFMTAAAAAKAEATAGSDRVALGLDEIVMDGRRCSSPKVERLVDEEDEDEDMVVIAGYCQCNPCWCRAPDKWEVLQYRDVVGHSRSTNRTVITRTDDSQGRNKSQE